MAEQCPECGVFMRRTRGRGVRGSPTEGWLCLNCNEHDVIDAVDAIRKALDLDPRSDTCAFAFGLADALHDVTNRGRIPGVIAASCVYLGSILAGEKLTQADVAAAADISVTTLRQAYRDFYDESGFADRYGEIVAGEIEPAEVSPAVDVEGWRDHLLAEGATPATARKRASNVRRFAKWYDGDGPPASADVASWLEAQADDGYAPATIDTRWGDVRQFFAWAGHGILDEDDVNLNAHLGRAYSRA